MPAIRRLKTATDVRSALANVYRKVEQGTMDLDTARLLVYCGSAIAGIIKTAEIEDRLAALEAKELANRGER